MYNNKLIELLKYDIEKKDLEYRNSTERKEEGWKIHSYISRSLKTKCGILRIKLTKYYKKINEIKHTKIFRDSYLEQNKYQRVDKTLQKEIGKTYYLGVSSYKIANNSLNKISQKTVINYKEKIIIQDKVTDYKNLSKNKKYIYIDIDDTYKLFRGKDRRVFNCRNRTATIHLGKTNEKNPKIIGKTTIIEQRNVKDLHKKTYKEWAIFLKKTITKIYGNHLKIFIIGDGAWWIKKISNHLNSKYILDHYHLIKKGFNVLGYTIKNNRKNFAILHKYEKKLNINFFKKYSEYVKTFNFETLIRYLEFILKLIKTEEYQKKLELLDLIKYINNNKTIRKNYDTKKGYIGSHTETFVNHNIKSKLKRNFATFSLKTSKKILNFYSNENLKYIFI